MDATCLAGTVCAGGALWAIVPTSTLARGCAVGAVDRLFSSESSVKRLQFLRVCPDLSSPRSFLNPCSVQGPSSCSLAERYARASSRGCLDLQSRFWAWGASSWLSLCCIQLLSRCLLSLSSGKPAATISGLLSSSVN